MLLYKELRERNETLSCDNMPRRGFVCFFRFTVFVQIQDKGVFSNQLAGGGGETHILVLCTKQVGGRQLLEV